MADHILFEKEINFCMIFVLAASWPTWESAHGLYLILPHLDLNIDFRIGVYVSIKIL